MRVAVTGATGVVGAFVVAELAAQGHEVVAWRRSAADPASLRADVTWVEGALGDAPSSRALVERADALVHAAFAHVPGRYRGGEGDDVDGFLRANLQGSLTLFDAARAAEVDRVVLLSTRAVYGPRLAGRPLDERHPLRPDTLYGAHKAALEAIVCGWGKAAGLGWCSLRSTGVFGLRAPFSRSKWAEVVDACRRGVALSPRGGTEVFGPDLARAVRLLLTAPVGAVGGEAFNCSDVFVTHRAVSRLAGGPLAPASTGPAGLMMTDKLQDLGWRPSGWPAVAATVEALVAGLEGEARAPPGQGTEPRR
ncbi:MAG: NAD(P)-dependent oxidoreductase [Pseudomonadota bacterium]